MRSRIFLAAPLMALMIDPASAAGDPKRGAQLFGQCMACHSVQADEHMTGPSLARIWNREAGSMPGFMRYSDPVKQSGITWNAAALDKWLADPAQLIPGKSMTFSGIKYAQARQDLVAHLEAVDESKAPPASKG